MSDKGSAVAVEQTDDIDDFAGDVASALSELRGGAEPEPDAQITLDKSEQRDRDESGRFAKALKGDDKPERKVLTLPEKPEGVQADPAAQLGVPAPADASPVLPTPAAPAVKVPEGVHRDLKSDFSNLDPRWQAEISRREAEFHKAITTNDDDRNMGKRINQLSSPYLPTIRAEGATVEKAFENYLQTAHVLRSGTPYQKAQALQAIAQQFNVDMNLPLQGAGSDPRYAHLEQRYVALESKLQAQDQQRQQQEDQSILSAIADFGNQPGHEHFQTVKVHMGALMEAGAAKDMAEAYQMAIWAHPDLRSTLVANEQKAAEEKRKTEQLALSQRARDAAVSVTGSPGGSRPLTARSGGSDSIEDDVRAAAQEIRGRV